MPAYSWMNYQVMDGSNTATKMQRLRVLGVPYTDEDIAGAKDFVNGKTEMDAVVAYLQQLGTVLKDTR